MPRNQITVSLDAADLAAVRLASRLLRPWNDPHVATWPGDDALATLVRQLDRVAGPNAAAWRQPTQEDTHDRPT